MTCWPACSPGSAELRALAASMRRDGASQLGVPGHFVPCISADAPGGEGFASRRNGDSPRERVLKAKAEAMVQQLVEPAVDPWTGSVTLFRPDEPKEFGPTDASE